MCTVTFVPRKRGYILGMNRDEKRTRPKGLPPTRRKFGNRSIICPSEPSGGTWIALNDRGVTLAVINWYSVSLRARGNVVSRGEIIPAVGAAENSRALARSLAPLPFDRINPFRLIGVFPATEQIVEWQWDLQELTHRSCLWKSQQWISSGFDEFKAQEIRNRSFEKFQNQASTGTTDWLRRLHCSHSPGRGPFSTCMHRSDAVTVSYTEISISPSQQLLYYKGGSPCAWQNACNLFTRFVEPYRPLMGLSLSMSSMHRGQRPPVAQ